MWTVDCQLVDEIVQFQETPSLLSHLGPLFLYVTAMIQPQIYITQPYVCVSSASHLLRNS